MEWSLLNGNPNGVSTFFIDEGIDTGLEVVFVEEFDVRDKKSILEAKTFLFQKDFDMYMSALASLQNSHYRPFNQPVNKGKRYYAMSNLLSEGLEDWMSNSNKKS